MDLGGNGMPLILSKYDNNVNLIPKNMNRKKIKDEAMGERVGLLSHLEHRVPPPTQSKKKACVLHLLIYIL